MFYSRNVVSNTLLYERPADSMDAFSQSLAEMRTSAALPLPACRRGWLCLLPLPTASKPKKPSSPA